jgi:hypothetical protein
MISAEQDGKLVGLVISRSALEFAARATIEGKDASLLALVRNKRRFLRAAAHAVSQRGKNGSSTIKVLATDMLR